MDKVVLLVNKTSSLNLEKTLKSVYFLFILFGVLMTGCSLVPKQKAGSDALAEAICIYDKKIDQKSSEFSKCITDQVR